MKTTAQMRKKVSYGLLVIMLFVYSIPAYGWTYNIQWGDSLYGLSQRYNTSVHMLKSANQLPSDRILAGNKLWIPDEHPIPPSPAAPSPKANSNDLELLARLINGEARGESFEGQVAVGAVILNRVKAGNFPNTVAGNVYKAGEFESVANGQIWQPLSSNARRAAEAALSGWTPVGVRCTSTIRRRSRTRTIGSGHAQ
jgi:N-acetylmuramoyl-L-alanine amidase